MRIESTAAAPVGRTSTARAGAGIDFRSITPEQMQAEMNARLKSGAMTLEESQSLVGMIPTALSKVEIDGRAPAAYTQSTDFIARIQAGIAGARSRSDAANEAALAQSLAALERMQGSPKTVDLRA